MDDRKAIEVLNVFISINTNRLGYYNSACSQTNDLDLIDLFTDFQEKSIQYNAQLQSEINRLGGNTNKKTTSFFACFWIKIKSKFTITDREDLLNRCEYYEYNTIRTYVNLVKNNIEYLTPTVRNMLKAQRQSIKIDHDILQSLGNMLLNYNKVKSDI